MLKTKEVGQNARHWIAYAQLELDFGDRENARKILKKGVQFSKFDTELLFQKAREFEKIYGSLAEMEDLEKAILRKSEEIQRREVSSNFFFLFYVSYQNWKESVFRSLLKL